MSGHYTELLYNHLQAATILKMDGDPVLRTAQVPCAINFLIRGDAQMLSIVYLKQESI